MASEVIDLTGSPPPPPHKRARAAGEAAAAGGPGRADGAGGSAGPPRASRLARVLAVLPNEDAGTVQSVLDCHRMLDDDASVQQTLLLLTGDVSDAVLASRAAAEESRAACRADRGLAQALAQQDSQAAVRRAPRSSPFHAEPTAGAGAIMHMLTECLKDSGAGETAFVCAHVSMFASVRGFDRGWGCGYRNAQMLLSHLLVRSQRSGAQGPLRPYCARLFSGAGSVPSVSALQSLIEEAWASGFDATGAAQLGGQLRDTRKWIGATEVAVLLRSQGVRAHIIDFSSLVPPHANDLFRWVWNYFERGRSKPVVGAGVGAAGGAARGRAVFHSLRAPLYLQHQGHSRLVVGALRKGDTVQLLILDPGMCPDELMAALSTSNWQRKCVFSMESFKIRQYQLVEVQDDGLGFSTATTCDRFGAGAGGSSTAKASGGKEDGRQQRCSIFLEPEEMEAAKVIAAKEAIGEGF
jgi:hypothetical protein